MTTKTQYLVRYEIEARPGSVIVEIICKDEEDQIKVYEERKDRIEIKKLKMFTKEI